jgi:hypothetical protein
MIIKNFFIKESITIYTKKEKKRGTSKVHNNYSLAISNYYYYINQIKSNQINN